MTEYVSKKKSIYKVFKAILITSSTDKLEFSRIILSIIGFALIRDVNLLNEFEFKIYNNNSLSELEISNLKKLANPISNIFARYKWSWRLFNKYEKTVIDRESYNSFSRYALSFSNEYVGNDEDKKRVYLEKAVNLLASLWIANYLKISKMILKKFN